MVGVWLEHVSGHMFLLFVLFGAGSSGDPWDKAGCVLNGLCKISI